MRTNPYLRIRVGKSLNRKRNSLIYNEPTSKENKTKVYCSRTRSRFYKIQLINLQN